MSTINHLQGYAFAKKKGDRIDVFEGPHTLADFMPVIAEGSDVPRMLKDRFADEVNVRDFGAKGDGVADDTEAFNLASGRAKEGGTVRIPSGTYVISGVITTKPVNFVGDGQGGTTLKINNVSNDPELNFVEFSENLLSGTSCGLQNLNIFLTGGNGNNLVDSTALKYERTPSQCYSKLKIYSEFTDKSDDSFAVKCSWKKAFNLGDSTELELSYIVMYGSFDSAGDPSGQFLDGFVSLNPSGAIMHAYLSNILTHNVANGIEIHDNVYFHLSNIDIARSKRGIFDSRIKNDYSYGESVWTGVAINSTEKCVSLHNRYGLQVNGLFLHRTADAFIDADSTWIGADFYRAINCNFTNVEIADGSSSDTNVGIGINFNGGDSLNVTNLVLYNVTKGVEAGITGEETARAINVCNVAVKGKVSTVINGASIRDCAFTNLSYSGEASVTTPIAFGDALSKSSAKITNFESVTHIKGDTIYIVNPYASAETKRYRIDVRNGLTFGTELDNGGYGKTFFIVTRDGTSVTKTELRAEDGYVNINAPEMHFAGSLLKPSTDNIATLGSSAYRWSQVYAGAGAINTSDERAKADVTAPQDALLKAIQGVDFHVFRFKDAVEKKGDAARIHAGVVAQEVQAAFATQGLDAADYGLFCYDKWDDEYEDVEVVDQPEVLGENGEVVSPAVTHTEQRLITAAGDRYGIRYEELLMLECARLRRELQRMKTALVAHGITLGDEQ